MFTLKPLSFEKNALEPYISAKTLDFHYNKHHQTYIDNLNKFIAGSELENSPLEEIIKKTAGNKEQIAIFNNASQVYNHDFFWRSLKESSKEMMIGEKTKKMINDSFGSLENFFSEFKAAALGQFGSGWTWLIKEGSSLKISKTANAQNPLTEGALPLFVIDVWEHAYYLDYQNRRADFIEAVLRNLVNWDFIELNI